MLYRYEFIGINSEMKLVVGEAYSSDEEKIKVKIEQDERISIHSFKRCKEESLTVMEGFVKWRYV